MKPKRGGAKTIRELVADAQERIFFLDYAPVLIASARTGENVERLFGMIDNIDSAAAKRIGTGVLNRLMRAAFAANPPPMVKGKRLKLFYAAQSAGSEGPSRTGTKQLQPAHFVLFVNEPRLLSQSYARYLEAQIRKAEPYPGVPIILTLRPRGQK